MRTGIYNTHERTAKRTAMRAYHAHLVTCTATCSAAGSGALSCCGSAGRRRTGGSSITVQTMTPAKLLMLAKCAWDVAKSKQATERASERANEQTNQRTSVSIVRFAQRTHCSLPLLRQTSCSHTTPACSSCSSRPAGASSATLMRAQRFVVA